MRVRAGTGRDVGPDALLDLALAVGAAGRITRFLVTDHLGEWLLVGHVRAWAARHEEAEVAHLKRALAANDRLDDIGVHEPDRRPFDRPGTVARLAEAQSRPLTTPGKVIVGLDCPHCVAVWASALVGLAWAVLPRGLWRWGTAVLGVAWVTGRLAGSGESGA